jgi:hypothetical protein
VNHLDTCDLCDRALIEIDYYGERLIGSVECNRLVLAGKQAAIQGTVGGGPKA